mgnify:CR=1 FL=1
MALALAADRGAHGDAADQPRLSRRLAVRRPDAVFCLVACGVFGGLGAAAAGCVSEDDFDGFTTAVDALVAADVAVAARAAFSVSARCFECERLRRDATTKSVAE